MDTQSLWKAITVKSTDYPVLDKDIEVDVAIIGGGITGVTAALHLIESGKKVAILEAEEVGGVTTGFSSGNLYVAVQPYFQNIISKFGLETAKQIAHSRKLAIDTIEKNVNAQNIKCHFSRRPWYVYTEDEDKIPFLQKEVEVFNQMEIPVNTVNSLPLPIKFKKAALMENQARFNPLQYVVSLAEHLQSKGCLIFEKTRVMNISEGNDRCSLETARGKVTAKNTIIATHTPIGISSTQLFTAPYRSYVVAAHLNDNVYPEGHFWDLNHPHHAICTHSISSDHPELLLVAGNHHKVGQAKDANSHYTGLEQFLRKNFSIKEFAYRWSSQHYHAADDIPYIGLASRSAKNTYIATGYFADGLVYGTLAGMIIGDLISNKENALSKIYNSNRFTPIASASFLMRENSNVFLQYLKDLPQLKAKSVDDVKAGEGKVLDIKGEKCGVYRDNNQKLHIVSAVCTHMMGIVTFNNAENTWDCPCHGSRFTTEGDVIEGPAKAPLTKINEREI